jgi:hypothetical protein
MLENVKIPNLTASERPVSVWEGKWGKCEIGEMGKLFVYPGNYRDVCNGW